jgi:hypothetical protein
MDGSLTAGSLTENLSLLHRGLSLAESNAGPRLSSEASLAAGLLM